MTLKNKIKGIMEYDEARYIINFFPRLMNETEQKANKHHFSSIKLGKPEDYKNFNSYQIRKEFFEKRNGITNKLEVLKLLEKGYDNFVIKTAERIKKEAPNQYSINKCPKCSFIARTPYAKQCRNCKNNWHDEIVARFQFDTTLKITGIKYFWIVGELQDGHIEIGQRIDLTNFQLNIIAEIKQIEFCLKSVNAIKKDFPSLGIEISKEQEKLIKKYLTKSAKTIMILKGKS